MDEPYLLASYNVDGVTTADQFAVRVNGLQYHEDSVVYVGTSSRAKQRERRAVAVTTVQRNGVHLVDAMDQSPLSTLTVSPSTVFTTAAVAVSLPRSAATEDSVPSTSKSLHTDRERKIFAGIRNPEHNEEHQLWCWTESERADGTSEGLPVRSTKTFPSAILALSIQTSSHPHLLVATQDGGLHAFTLQLEIVTSMTATQLSASASADSPPIDTATIQTGISAIFLPNELEIPSDPPAIALSQYRCNRAGIVRKKVKTAPNGNADISEASNEANASCTWTVLIVDIALRAITVCAWANFANVASSPILLPGAMIRTISLKGIAQTFSLELKRSQTAVKSMRSVELAVYPSSNGSEGQSSEFHFAAVPCTSTGGLDSRMLNASSTSQKTQIELSIYDAQFQAVTATNVLAVSGVASLGEEYNPQQLFVDIGQLTRDLFVVGQSYKPSSTPQRAYVHAVSTSSLRSTKLASVLGSGPPPITSVENACDSIIDEIAAQLAVSGQPSAAQIANLLAKLRAAPPSQPYYSRIAQMAAPKVARIGTAAAQSLRMLIAQFLLERTDFSDDLCRPDGFTAALLDANMLDLAIQAAVTLDNVTERSLVRCLVLSASQKPNAVRLPQMMGVIQSSPFSAQRMQVALREECSAGDLAVLLPVIIHDFTAKLPTRRSVTQKKVSDDTRITSPRTCYEAKLKLVSSLLDAHLITLLRDRDLHEHLRSLHEIVRKDTLVHGAIIQLQQSMRPFVKTIKSEKTIEFPARLQRISTEENKREQRTRNAADKGREKVARKAEHLKQIQAEKLARKRRLQEDSLNVGDYRTEVIAL